MKKRAKTNTAEILTNIIIWVFIFILPFLMFWKHEGVDMLKMAHNHGITVLSSALVFYTNYFFLTEKYLFRHKTWHFILLNILLILGAGLLVYFFKDFRLPPNADEESHSIHFYKYAFYFREVFTITIIASFGIVIKVLKKWFLTESQRQEEEKRRKEAELQNLRQQINPHFFFNTLNNIYALIEISPEKAQQTVLDLSKLMRYVLYENNHYFVPVNKEIDFIKNYIDLMRIRLTKDIDVRVNIQDFPVSGKFIVPMIFISLIENAFKHGISYTNPSFIHIDIYQIDNNLVCLIRNSFFPKNESDKSGSGIGLDNLKKRLNILYPHKHILNIKKEDNVYISELVVPLNE